MLKEKKVSTEYAKTYMDFLDEISKKDFADIFDSMDNLEQKLDKSRYEYCFPDTGKTKTGIMNGESTS